MRDTLLKSIEIQKKSYGEYPFAMLGASLLYESYGASSGSAQ